MRIGRIALLSTMTGPVTVFVGEKKINHPACNILRDFNQRVLLTATRWIFQLEIIAVDQRVALQRIQQQHIHRKPDRTAPITVAAEHPAVPFRGSVADGKMPSTELSLEWM